MRFASALKAFVELEPRASGASGRIVAPIFRLIAGWVSPILILAKSATVRLNGCHQGDFPNPGLTVTGDRRRVKHATLKWRNFSGFVLVGKTSDGIVVGRRRQTGGLVVIRPILPFPLDRSRRHDAHSPSLFLVIFRYRPIRLRRRRTLGAAKTSSWWFLLRIRIDLLA